MGRKKLESTRRKQQVKTYIRNNGREAYAKSGSKGGQNSPTKFNSESASAAAKLGWEKRKAAKQAAAEKEKNDGEIQKT